MHLAPVIRDAILANANKGMARSFYLYDLRAMRKKIRGLKAILPKSVELFYAMKANPHPAFLAAAKTEDVEGIEIASLGEGQKALAAGFTGNNIIFTGPGKSPEELRWCLEHGVRTIHLESLTEAHRLESLCAAMGKTQDILLRVNPNFHIHGAQASFSGDSSKMGVDERQLHHVLPQILSINHLRFKGLHVYAASGVLKESDLLKNCELVFGMAKDIEKSFQGARCSIIDFGGGFGIDYTESNQDFSPDVYADGLKKLIASHGFQDRTFVLELGRYLTADSGWYCTEILDIKDSLGKKQVICAGGSHHFRRPVALGINHPITILPLQQPKVFAGQERVSKEAVFLAGPLCNTADKLAAKEVFLENAEIGDMVVIGLAGAYGLSMSHTGFLSHALPPEIVLDTGV